jgi:hypothetical protein
LNGIERSAAFAEPPRTSASAENTVLEVKPNLVCAAEGRFDPCMDSSNDWNGLTARQTTRFLLRECDHYG